MPSLSAHSSSDVTKLLVIADSGAGKTGALASLASAGYHLRILDLDNGLDVLANLLTDPASPYAKEAISRVHYITLTEKMRNVNGKLMPGGATVWTRVANLLADWKDGDTSFGPVSTWDSSTILVIDSLSFLGTAAMNFALQLNGRLGQHPHQSDWGVAQNMLESLLQMLYSTDVKCNVIINCHITYLGEDGGPQRGYPNALGKALPPKIGRYFNSAFMIQSRGQGAGLTRRIITSTSGVVELKNTAPLRLKPEYPIATGLAECFYALHGKFKP